MSRERQAVLYAGDEALRREGAGGFAHERSIRGATDSWITPREITAALGAFDLDPCACRAMPWSHAAVEFTEADDGLSKEWRGRVWMNPPYGPEARRWLARLAEHGDGIAFIFARTETAAFFDHVWPKADALLFLRGRVRFFREDGTKGAYPTAPSVLVAYGARNAEALRTCGLDGAFVVPSPSPSPAGRPSGKAVEEGREER